MVSDPFELEDGLFSGVTNQSCSTKVVCDVCDPSELEDGLLFDTSNSFCSTKVVFDPSELEEGLVFDIGECIYSLTNSDTGAFINWANALNSNSIFYYGGGGLYLDLAGKEAFTFDHDWMWTLCLICLIWWHYPFSYLVFGGNYENLGWHFWMRNGWESVLRGAARTCSRDIVKFIPQMIQAVKKDNEVSDKAICLRNRLHIL